jgi:predicted transcriptional regulator
VLDLATKFEIRKVCEETNVNKSKIGRHCNLASSTLFMILKNKDYICSQGGGGNEVV